jgi:hypothetical protein
MIFIRVNYINTGEQITNYIDFLSLSGEIIYIF